MAWTQADVDALDAAIKNGAVHVRFSDGKEVTYRSMSDLLKARALAAVEVSAANGTIMTRQLRVYTDKGFGL
jgi:hypothetical protein